MGELKASVKPFDISKPEVWDAWVKVRGNKGSSGVDGVSVEAFEADLRNNLYKVWNRMSSGTYFPPDVKAVPIPKSGGGTRSFQDHVSLSILKGLCMTRPASRLASVMSRRPARWWAPTARLRRPAMTRGPDLVRTVELSSR
jgi:hypothetical protein